MTPLWGRDAELAQDQIVRIYLARRVQRYGRRQGDRPITDRVRASWNAKLQASPHWGRVVQYAGDR